MLFALLAIVAVGWSLVVLRWAIARKASPWRRRAMVVSAAGCLLALASIVIDLRAIRLRSTAHSSGVTIDVVDMGEWWQIEYRRGNRAFVTANEIHVPARSLVTIKWNGPPATVWRSHDFFSAESGDFAFVTRRNGVEDLAIANVWPPKVRHLQVVADGDRDFERWFADETRPAMNRSGAFLFTNSGCGFCHVVRGVSEEPSMTAPDLTHFGSRRTIAAIGIPNNRGYLSGWIVHSRALKRGSVMPQNNIGGPSLQELVTYLESLR